MRILKFYTAILILFMNIFWANTAYATILDEPDINAATAVIIDSKNKSVLYGKDEDTVMYPASTTKILTAILAIEHKNLDDTVTVSATAISGIPSGYSVAYLKEGEVVTISDLLKMLLLISANDAANVLAEAVSGSIDEFVVLMNEKISSLGLTSTNFTNTYGLHDTDHYSTAYDMAIILNYCISNPTFLEYSGLTSSTIEATNLSDPRVYTAGNRLLLSNHEYYYEYATAGKTGFTTPAGNCLVSSASKDDLDLVCVVLNSTSTFVDSAELFEYVFSKYIYVELLEKNRIITEVEVTNAKSSKNMLELKTNDSVGAVINVDDKEEYDYTLSIYEDISAPIEKGDTLGIISYVVDSKAYSTELIATTSIEEKDSIFTYIFGFAFIILILYTIYIFASYYIYMKKRKIRKYKTKKKYKNMRR